MSVVLALDSARRRGGAVAVAACGEVLAEVRHDPARGYAEAFFSLADEVLHRARLSREEVEEVAVVRGPGSFTGLRIGVMTAKSLAFARGWRLKACGSLEALAGRLDGEEEGAVALAVMDAGRDALYAGAFRVGERLEEVLAPRRCTPAELERALAAHREEMVVVCDGEEVEARLAGDLSFLAPRPRLAPAPLAPAVARAASRGRPWCAVADPVALLPLYLGPSQAERVHGVDLAEEVHRPRPPRPEDGR